jgi:predicted PolB exonuclease-like 3'-5' exonuclease
MAKRSGNDQEVAWFVFDVESVADGELISAVRYPGQELDAATAIATYRQELMERYDSDFIPYTWQIPVAVAVAKVDRRYRLIDVVTLDDPAWRPHVITENFWRGWLSYNKPTLVSFNGRGFDLPLLELAAFRYGISAPAWFNLDDRAYDQRRNRYNLASHFDLQDFFSNFGATRLNGGLNLIATLIGKPGKMEITGDQVQDLFDEGKVAAINDYCRCDVLDTYFIFLRVSVLMGKLTLEEEAELVDEARGWLEKQCASVAGYSGYLSQWGHWENPWQTTSPANRR